MATIAVRVADGEVDEVKAAIEETLEEIGILAESIEVR